ncbi:MAG TPA: MarR family transcriptional regulator [Lactobacillus sp.]|nr:MarR family transcriptional regulator [Lactobacillus sp.]
MVSFWFAILKMGWKSMNEQQKVKDTLVEMMVDSYLHDFRGVEQVLKSLAKEVGLSWRGLSLLDQVSRGNHLTLDELAKQNKITKGAVSTQTTNLLRLGLIRIEPNSEDRRQHILHLTAKGEEITQQLDVRTGERLAVLSRG